MSSLPICGFPILEIRTRSPILLGNTRALWPHFITALRSDSDLQLAADPVDSYVEAAVRSAIARVSSTTPQIKREIRFAHEPPPRRIAIQRLAEVAGLAALAPSHLCVHPTYGSWISLRAVIVAPLPFIRDACPIGTEHRYTDAAIRYFYSRDRAPFSEES